MALACSASQTSSPRPPGRTGLSIIVSDANAGARRLYERCGYAEARYGR